jgi:carbon storage regulator
MLVLTRRVGEVVVIGDDVHVTVLSVSGKQVRMGIKAPSSVPILRQELLYERIKNVEHADQTCTRDDTKGTTQTARCASSETLSKAVPDHDRDRSSLAQRPAPAVDIPRIR